jgi:hypothetical protein
MTANHVRNLCPTSTSELTPFERMFGTRLDIFNSGYSDPIINKDSIAFVLISQEQPLHTKRQYPSSELLRTRTKQEEPNTLKCLKSGAKHSLKWVELKCGGGAQIEGAGFAGIIASPQNSRGSPESASTLRDFSWRVLLSLSTLPCCG